MHYLLLLAAILLVLLGPQLWVGRVMARYHREDEENFPGNAGEFARHLLDRFGLQRIKVEPTEQGDHYDPQAGAVRLSQDKIGARTLTAIVTAAHEVGHALQHAADEPLLAWRTRLVYFAAFAQQLGSFLLFATPFLAVLTRAPSAGAITLLGAFLVLGINLLVQFLTLPVELDASYRKALPLLKAGYLSPEQYRGAEKILRAASLTYLSAALAGLLNFWRWLQVFKR